MDEGMEKLAIDRLRDLFKDNLESNQTIIDQLLKLLTADSQEI